MRVTSIRNQHVVNVITALREEQSYDPAELSHWSAWWRHGPGVAYHARCLKCEETFDLKPEGTKWQVEDLTHHYRKDHALCGGAGVLVGVARGSSVQVGPVLRARS